MNARQIRTVVVVALWVQAAFGQSTSGGGAAAGGGRQGLQVESVSVFGGYFTGGSPFGGTLPITGALGKEDLFGASAAFAWTRQNDKGGVSIQYSPSIIGSTQVSSLNSVNHRLFFN